MIIFSCGKKIKIKNGRKTQTVNIYTDKLKHGEYDYIVRMSGLDNFVKGNEINDKNFIEVNELIEYLKEYHYGVVEKSPQNKSFENYNDYKTGNIRTPNHAEFGKDGWIKEAVPESEKIINNFLKKFIDFPYLHRVEHSIHCDLYNFFVSDDLFNDIVELTDRTKIQILHKEWPEYIPRENKNNRRGNFDMAILAPESIKNKSINDFIYGRIEAPIVVEMGLNYKIDHFTEDFKKLKNSNVYRGYLLHLVRKEVVNDNSIEPLLLKIEEQYKNIKVGYVRHTAKGVRFKLIGDKEISKISL